MVSLPSSHTRFTTVKTTREKKEETEKDCMRWAGGGSLDRKEMAVGLFRLGVWLQPTELAALMEVLDEDGGGEIDLAEFSTWWNSTVGTFYHALHPTPFDGY